MRAHGAESILSWSVFDDLDAPACLFGARDTDNTLTAVESPPPLEHSLLMRLEAKYIEGVQSKNPVLDMPALRQMVLRVAENGLDWSVQTCLVSLVCALGAATDACPVPSGPTSPLSRDADADGVMQSEPGDMLLAKQFWNVAAKRLGLVLGQNTIQAAQCLCLTGIWYMYMLQPLEAWRHFDMAGTVWHSINLVSQRPRAGVDSSMQEASPAMQPLYFTIWKSECELRMEMSLPSPILDSVYFPYVFPTPPDVAAAGDVDSVGSERCWYYYLADIAARHLLNRLLRAEPDEQQQQQATASGIQRMLARADMIEGQVASWHESLPPTLRFAVPDSDAPPESEADPGLLPEPVPDELTLILRYRYFSLRELVGRPFVRLCVEAPAEQLLSLRRLHPSTHARVVALASQSLRYCMLKLHLPPAFRHQGLWLALRSVTSATLILSAANRTLRSRSQVAGEEPLQGLRLPRGWRERCFNAVEAMEPFWQEAQGGAAAMKNLVLHVLGEEASGRVPDGMLGWRHTLI